MHLRALAFLPVVAALGAAAVGAQPNQPPAAVAEIVRSLEPPELRDVVLEVLERDPELDRLRSEAALAEARAPQARALPDPTVMVTGYPLPPETRVGPQLLTAGIEQRLPWGAKREAAAERALHAAEAARLAEAERALEVVARSRNLALELAFLEEEEALVAAERFTLERLEELARSRYAAGGGAAPEVVRFQAEITRLDGHLLEHHVREGALLAELNALRDRPADTAAPVFALGPLPLVSGLDLEVLRATAAERRPELTAARARIAGAEAAARAAELERKPDFKVGLAYTLVDGRDDAAGRAMPPEGDGDDILALRFEVDLPVYSARIEAGVAEAEALRAAATDALRAAATEIERRLGDAAQRAHHALERYELFTDVLVPQADEARRLAEAAYAAGGMRALDVLDAERSLLRTRIATARARADHLAALADLESAVGAPLTRVATSHPPGTGTSPAPTREQVDPTRREAASSGPGLRTSPPTPLRRGAPCGRPVWGVDPSTAQTRNP